MVADLPPPVSSEDTVAENNAKKREARKRKADQDVLRKLMHTPDGRDWLYRFLDSCHMMASPFVPGSTDTNTIMFRLGEQNVGKRLQVAAEGASVDLYMTMIKEHLAEEAELEALAKEREAKMDATEHPRPPQDDDQYPKLSPPEVAAPLPPIKKPTR